MSSLRTQSLWSMVPILITSVVSIVSVPLYFHVLGDEMYAMWFYVSSFTGAFGFMDLGLGVAVGRYVGVALGAQDKLAAQEYWSTGNALVLPFVAFFSLVFIAAGTGWGPDWFKSTGTNAAILRWAMAAGGIGLFFAYYGQMWNMLAQAHLDFRYLSVIRSVFSILAAFGSIGVALATKNVAAIVAFTSLLGAIQFVILWWRNKTTYHLSIKLRFVSHERFREMLPYTLKTFAQLLCGSILGTLDRVVLGRWAPSEVFAAYNVGLNFGSRISGLSVAVMGPIFMNTSRGVGGDQVRSPAAVYRQASDLMVGWLGLIALWVAVWQKPILHVWLGSDRGPMVGQAFSWIVAAFCLSAFSNISGAQLGSLNRVGTGLIISTGVNILSAIAVLSGWFLLGLQGAAAGFFFSRLSLFAQDFIVRRLIGMGYEKADFSVLAKLCVMALLMIVIYLGLAAIDAGLAWQVAIGLATGIFCAAYLFADARKQGQ